ncbi:hypothetical protein BEP19_04205 [Ammoniphilus oxalaticus]|uniref:PsbP C-terminal domain-containing protein n=1 Tax=Ammoniphilus oxalaticus TaxID=66863 RepID=A0A419SLZ5_9BACL|nr:hypothetical protein [Ammoniphilus oxalaticus]RKD25036.1 hypothetical protein BEP19_04205 [Ammoniphilus oxalaticus]
MRKWMMFVMAGVIALSVTGCQEKGPSNEPQGERLMLDKEYTNSFDSYKLDLPQDWARVEILEDEEERTTVFIFPSEDPTKQQALMTIIGMSAAEWDAIKAEGKPSLTQFKEIKEHEGSYYILLTPLDQVLEGEELERYEQMVKQVPVIVAGMHF